ncbi:16S rRNA (cytidine(1402)-2'-O)-methyltransferase [Dehalococcoidia bacterium]|nr:16S rRNA (cytidine(1402)-2'-O)-methyltransferase [Dehalococcoidia bacterium]
MSTLYVVATPIGNLEDVTLRAIRVLHEVGLIAAEDTRRTKRLLCAHQIKTPLTSYHEHNKQAKLPYLLRALEHGDVALISEAGMPGINDPGYDLVLAAIDRDVKVVPVPGPSAIPTALAVSGLTTEQFIHLGFLPRKKGARRKLLQSIAAEPRTIVAFETPHRLRSALVDLGEVLGERRLAICREMTKLHEEIFRGTVSQAIEHFAKPRGEFTLVIEGKAREPRCADRPRLDGFERGKYNRD